MWRNNEVKNLSLEETFQIPFEEREEIKQYVYDTQHNFIENITYFYDGYSVDTLTRILPADIPVIIVSGRVTKEEIALLKRAMKCSCIIAQEISLIQLMENGVEPDFFVALDDRVKDAYPEGMNQCEVPMITNTAVCSELLKKHIGQKFFFFTGNVYEQEFIENAISQSARKHQYNRLALQKGSFYENALWIGEMLGASRIIILGDTATQVIVPENIKANVAYKVENENIFGIEYNLSAILSEILPFLDENGRTGLRAKMESWIEQNNVLSSAVLSSISLYIQLYKMAIQGTALAEEVQGLTDALNQNTACMEKCDCIKYVLDILEKIKQNVSKKYEAGNKNVAKNEVAQIAEDGRNMFEKLFLIIKTLEKCFNKVKKEGLLNRKPNRVMTKEHIPSILVICGVSQYSVLPFFAKELKKGFQSMHYHTYFNDSVLSIDRLSEAGYSSYQNMIGYDYVLMLNGAYEKIDFFDVTISQRRYIWDNLHTKVIELFVDHPVWQMGRLLYKRKFVITVWPDDNWRKYLEDYFPQIENRKFLPLGGIEQSNTIAFSNKEKKVVFFGSYEDLRELEEKINQHNDSALIWNIIHYLKQQPSLTIEQAMEQIAKENECEYSMEVNIMQLELLRMVDTYIRQYYRQKVVIELAEQGIPITLYGWKGKQFENHSNVCIKEAVSMNEMLEICQKTRFVLNVNPWLKKGTQERVFNTMLGGSICITDANQYLEQECEDQNNILFYQLDEIEKLPDKIRYYMEHDVEAEKIAKSGYLLAKEKHTWSKRAEQLVNLLNMPKNF